MLYILFVYFFFFGANLNRHWRKSDILISEENSYGLSFFLHFFVHAKLLYRFVFARFLTNVQYFIFSRVIHGIVSKNRHFKFFGGRVANGRNDFLETFLPFSRRPQRARINRQFRSFFFSRDAMIATFLSPVIGPFFSFSLSFISLSRSRVRTDTYAVDVGCFARR